MQPLALYAIAIGVVMIAGSSVTLFRTRHAVSPRYSRIGRWQLHGTIPLVAAGLVIGVVAHGSAQSAATHEVTYAVATTLLACALLCALFGAAAATRERRSIG